MANWTKLSDGTWGVQSKTGAEGDSVTVTKASGATSRVTLGRMVKRTKWGRVFRVAGRKAAPRARRARRAPRARRAAPVARPVARPVAVAAPVAVEEVDASVARFRLLDLSDDVADVADVEGEFDASVERFKRLDLD